MSEQRHPGLHGLVAQLPEVANYPTLPSKIWTCEDRQLWLAAVTQVLDFVLPVGSVLVTGKADD